MLTTSVEVVDGTPGNDTFKGLLAATGSTLQSGDVINGKGGNDTLDVLVTGGDGTNPAPAIDGVKTLQFRTLASNGTPDQVDLALATGYTDVVVHDSIGTDTLQFNDYNTAAKLTVKNATATNTSVKVNSFINSVSADNDSFTVAFDTVGKIATTGPLAATVEITPTGIETYNVQNSNGESRVILNTNGVTGDTALATMNVNATAKLQIATGSSLINLTKFDASASTATVDVDLSNNVKNISATGGKGDDVFRFGTSLTSGDTVSGGTDGTDTVVATIGSAMQYAPTLSSIEEVDATFTSAGVLNLTNAPDVQTLKIAGSTANVSVTNAQAALKTLSADASNTGTFSLAYKSGANGNLTVNLGKAQTTAGAGVALGASTTINGATSVTINSIGNHSSANSTGALALDAAIALALTTANKDADLTVGNLTANKLQTLTVNATAGDVSVGTLAGAGALTNVSATLTGGADLTIGAIGATTEASKLAAVSVVAGDASAISLATNITAYDATLAAGSRTALTDFSLQVGDQGTITVGDVAAGTDNSSGKYDGATMSVSIKAGADLGNSSIGTIIAKEISSLDITRGDNATASALAVTAIQAATIGDVNVTTGKNASVTITSLGDSDSTSSDTTHSIGNITVSVGDSSTVTINPKGAADATMGLVSASGKGSLSMTTTGIASTAGVDVSNLEGTATLNFQTLTTGTTFTLGKGLANLVATQGADIITAGTGGGKISGWLGADDITLNKGNDTVVISGGNLDSGVNFIPGLVDANADTIRNFKVAGTDVIQLDIKGAGASGISSSGSFLTASTSTSTDPVSASGTNLFADLGSPSSGTSLKVANAANLILEVTNTTTDGTPTGLVNAIKNGAASAALDKDGDSTPNDNGWQGFIVSYTTSGDAQVWYKSADVGSNSQLEAAELHLVATITGVAANSLSGADFAFV